MSGAPKEMSLFDMRQAVQRGGEGDAVPHAHPQDEIST